MKQRIFMMALLVMLAAAVIAGVIAARLHDATGGETVGPVVVYTESGSSQSGNATWFVAYDLGARRELRRTALVTFEYKLTSRNEVLYVVVGPDSRTFDIRRLDPGTGSAGAIYSSPLSIGISFAVSPDGTLLAFGESPWEETARIASVRVIDLRDSSVRTILELPNTLTRLHGRPAPLVWRDDGRGFVVLGALPGPPGPRATVMLNGAVTDHPFFGELSPNGRAMVRDGTTGLGCILTPIQRLSIIDLDTNLETAVVEDPQRGTIVREWSPDGRALLYAQYRAIPGGGDSCAPEPDPATARWFLLNVSGGPPISVPDLAALKRQWYGDRNVEFECVNAPVGGSDTVFGHCQPGGRTLLVGGQKVATGEIGEVLGFIDPRAQP